MEYSGKKSFGMMCMVQKRVVVKRGVYKEFFKQPTPPADNKAIVAKFNHSITAVKTCVFDGGKFDISHITFQSTPSYNIQSVNLLNKNTFFTSKKYCGGGN